jgi:DNA repair protein RadC
MEITVYKCVVKKAGKLRVAEPVVNTGALAARVFRALSDDSPVEVFMALFLDNAMNVLGTQVLATGFRGGVAFTPAEVLRPAIACNASAVIVGHNHPSGNPNPSPEDHETTASMRKACDAVGINMLDHVIVTRNGRTYSFVENRGRPVAV